MIAAPSGPSSARIVPMCSLDDEVLIHSNWPLSYSCSAQMKNHLKPENLFSALQIPSCGSQHGLTNSYCSTFEARELRGQETMHETLQASIWLKWFHIH